MQDNPKIRPIHDKVFNVDPDLEISEELVSLHGINPFIANDSASRSQMVSSHLSQALTLEYGDERIIQTGYESQFGDNTFACKANEDVKVLKVIDRYDGIDKNSVNKTTQIMVIVENIATGEVDYIDVPYKHNLHQYFGFKYKWDAEMLENLTPGTVLSKDTVLADSPAVTKNKGYKFGINANLALLSLPETAEDGVVISRSTVEKMSYHIYETRVVEFGSDSFPLNIYGDDETYKAFPEIGDKINDDSVVMVLRDYEPDLAPAINSINDVREYNPVFDKCVYVKGPGADKVVNGYAVETGVVKDIKIQQNKIFKKYIYSNVADDVTKYVNGYKKFQQDIIDVYETLLQNHYLMYKNNDMKVSEKFHRLLIDAYAITNRANDKISYSYRNESLDLFRAEITVEYLVTPVIGSKASDTHGSLDVK